MRHVQIHILVRAKLHRFEAKHSTSVSLREIYNLIADYILLVHAKCILNCLNLTESDQFELK